MQRFEANQGCRADVPEGIVVHFNFIAGARRCFDQARRNDDAAIKALFTQIGLDYLKIAYEEALPAERRIAVGQD